MLAYYRLGQYDEARRSMQHLLEFAKKFRMDNPLTKCGSDVYQPNQPINLCYDTFGPAAAFLRGLFEYLYQAEGLTLMPHIPPRISELHQLDPVRFGPKRIWLSTYGVGAISAVKVNGRNWKQFDSHSIFLPFDKAPAAAQVEIALGGAKFPREKAAPVLPAGKQAKGDQTSDSVPARNQSEERLREFRRRLNAAGLGHTYEAAHLQLALDCFQAARARQSGLRAGTIQPLPAPAETAAEKCYADSATKLSQGLEALLKSYADETDPDHARKRQLWLKATAAVEASKR